ncbi:hypothetical protein A9Q83_05540 [Alphaproteobacteria bacterium 46_93_T64]|nr:hypothetical protein A9Q83_05540 [Alphaproteobacteria bacterium 46_93_T64]
MKFLMFNLVVGAALIFLFTSDKAAYQSVAEDTHNTVQELKGKAQEVVVQIKPTDQPRMRQPDKAASKSAEYENAVAYVPVAGVPDDLTRMADALEEEESSNIAEVTDLDLAELSPDVAKRREQILEPAGSADVATKFTIETRENRQEELQSLSEEMELFSAEVSVQ